MKVLHEDENAFSIEDAKMLDRVLSYFKEKGNEVNFIIAKNDLEKLLGYSIDDFYKSVISYLEGLGMLVDLKHNGNFKITPKGSRYSFLKNFQEKENNKSLTVKSMKAQIDAVRIAEKSNTTSKVAIGISIIAVLLSLFKEIIISTIL